jgi:valyl-tRNA synthetase
MSDAAKTDLPKAYDPSALERRWYAEWLDKKYFHADAAAPKAPFSLVIPPPNVTGSLHMGHALGRGIEDIFARWRRMAAYNTMWLPGTDHAGIATQLVVERDLKETEGKSRHDLGREAFIERVWAWRQKSGDRILEQLKVMGCSLDWDRTAFTMDPGYSKTVTEVFVRLYEQGLMYRDRRLINWCISCRTALSDLEVEYDEGAQGELYEFAYPLADGSGELVVATTRPETMLGDTAVAVHPDDPRHKAKIGKLLKHPFVDREFPVIADPVLVDPKFGTGAVKVTPAHDPNDFESGQRNKLAFISILDGEGKVTAEGGPFAGMDRFAARKAVKAGLAQKGLERGSKKHTHAVGHCQRCDTIVEPLISTQWFVKMEPLAKPAIEAVEQGKTRFVPESWTKTYFHWMRNIRDWCVSRQLWWGHRIPAWYCADNHVTVARTAPEACGQCGNKQLRQDEDVLDTWFSSWLWPFATLGWPEETRELRTFYPTTLLVTGYDILFFWVARMMMAGLHFMNKVPFRTVYLHTIVTDEKGEKMSKVKKNTIDPLDVIQKHGADALRFALAWLTTHAAQGKNIKFSMHNVEDARRFANKIWNAARFALMNLEGYDPERFGDRTADGPDGAEFDLPERWMLSRVQRAAETVNTALDEYRIADAAQAVYHFIWDELCDWYIEFAKGRLASATKTDDPNLWKVQGTLVTALETAMRLLHPFMPFITEEIWQRLPKPGGSPQSIMITLYPMPDPRFVDDASDASMALVQKVVSGIRGLRADHNIPSIVRSRTILTVADDYKKTILEGYKALVAEQARCAEITVRRGGETPAGPVATTVAGEVEVTLMLDLPGGAPGEAAAAEKSKLQKERSKLAADRDFFSKKLGNPQFVERAKPEVIEKDRAKLAELEAALARLDAALARL